jgi:hypothetical protein
MGEAARLASFLVFVALGARVAAGGPARPRALQVFLAYACALALGVGLSQRDAWPFSSYPIAAGLAGGGERQTWIELCGVDDLGHEWTVDPRAWSPLAHQTVQLWFVRSWAHLSVQERREAGRFLLGRAEAARARLASGASVGRERVLGPLAAPDWSLLHGVHAPVPATPLRSLRIYEHAWVPREAYHDPALRQRTLVAEFDRS